jgi:hypothetical protein
MKNSHSLTPQTYYLIKFYGIVIITYLIFMLSILI